MQLQKSIRRFFMESGERGGRARARRLSPAQRSLIASQAARARWQKNEPPLPLMPSIRLSQADWDNPVYLEEVLSRGRMPDWKRLYDRITDRPFGTTAAALQKVLASEEIYGITPLWKGLLCKAQGSFT